MSGTFCRLFSVVKRFMSEASENGGCVWTSMAEFHAGIRLLVAQSKFLIGPEFLAYMPSKSQT